MSAASTGQGKLGRADATRQRNRPPFSVDLDTVPSMMEQRAARWSKPDRGSDHAG